MLSLCSNTLVIKMPKKKITLEEAFAVFEREGLKVEVKAIQPTIPQPRLEDFLETAEEVQPTAIVLNKSLIRVTLYASHTVGNGGEIIVGADGNKHVVNNGVVSYGPGVVSVPTYLAQHLLHQDMLARRADHRTFSGETRSFAVSPQRTAYGVVNVARVVSLEPGFDIAGYVTNQPSMYQL